MKPFLKILLLVAAVVFIKKEFIDDHSDFKKRNLLPLDVSFVQGPKPEDNQPLLVEFWATWCGPCRQTIPHLNEIYAKYHPRGLNAVGISNESASTVEGFMHQVPMNYPVALDAPGRYSRELNIRGIPHAFLLDRQGKVVWEGHPMELSEAQIEKVL